MSFWFPCSVFFFLKIYVFLERGEGREKERERNINVWLLLALLQLGTSPPDMCPNWELNQWPFGSQAGTQSTEPHYLGCPPFSLEIQSIIQQRKRKVRSTVLLELVNMSIRLKVYWLELACYKWNTIFIIIIIIKLAAYNMLNILEIMVIQSFKNSNIQKYVRSILG